MSDPNAYHLKSHYELDAWHLRRLAIKFWRQVDKTGDCWEWVGNVDRNGYGSFKLSNDITNAHRAVWVLTHGPTRIPKGICVAHRCDNRKCVRPDHLFLGTHSDNIQDSITKGRWPRKRATVRLDADKALWIRRVRQTHNLTYDELAWLMSVSTTTIWAVLKGISWADMAARP